MYVKYSYYNLIKDKRAGHELVPWLKVTKLVSKQKEWYHATKPRKSFFYVNGWKEIFLFRFG